MIRRPAVAGAFYPGDPAGIDAALARLVPAGEQQVDARAVVVPHAGWGYSGAVAGAVYGRIRVPRLVVVLGPDHRGRGPGASIVCEGSWALPGAEVPIASALARAILAAAPGLAVDAAAHRDEHAIEVQLPFLRRARPDVALVPIALWDDDPGRCRALGRGLAAAAGAAGEPVLLVCSTDLTHYEADEVARRKDRLAIDAMLALDDTVLREAVSRHDISMCGLAPALVTLAAARDGGARSATLVRYATSGEVSGDRDRVVGYAGLLVGGLP